MDLKKLVLIDGHSILFRAFHGMPDMTNAEGVHTNAVYGFLRILFRILDLEKPDALAVAFDTSKPTFRHLKYEAYKGTRKAAPPEFHEQVPLVREILRAMEIPVLRCEGYEADDLLGTAARQASGEGVSVTIVSGDHDLLQIADDRIKISIPSTRGGKTEIAEFYAADVLEQYHVTPLQFIDVKALMGDSSDNIPGVPGIGKVNAEKLISTYGSIEGAYAHAEEIPQKKIRESLLEHYDLAVLSKDLATIRTDAPLEFSTEDARIGLLYTNTAYDIFKRLGFRSFFDRFDAKESTAQRPALEILRVEDGAEAERIFREAANESVCGAAYAYADADVHYERFVLSSGGKTYLFLPEDGMLSVSALRKAFQMLLKSGTTLAVCGTKDFRRQAAEEGSFFDPVIAAYLLNPLKNDYTYDAVSSEILGQPCPSEEELIGKKGLAQAIADGKADAADEMLCRAADVACRSVEPLRSRLAEAGMRTLFEEVEMPLTRVLASMERAGILVNPMELAAYGETLSGRIEELTMQIQEAAGEPFNLNSPKQLGRILFEKMGLPGGKKTKTGYSTAADVLEKLAPEHPIVRDLLEYRQLAKLKSTYADGLAAFIANDGRIHTNYHQTITATGRLSSTDPNLQNIPMRVELGRRIRKCFVPAPGNIFIDADYSQIELRILAHMSGDANLIAAYREAKDIHRITASQVFGVPFEEVTELQRRNAKAVNFGIVYGISSFGLSQGLSISPKEAEQYIRDYFAAYPGIKRFLDGLVASAKEKGYAESLYHRKRPVPELASANFMQRSFGERVAMNSPIQGTAADIMKMAMIRVFDRLNREKLHTKMILQIHDELLLEGPAEEQEKASRILTEEMEHAADLLVELKTDCHAGTDWYEAK